MPDTSTQSWKLLYESGREALQARKLQDAEQSFSAALQLAEDFAPSDPRLAATLNALARIYSLQRRYLAAAALLNRLLEVTERTLGPTHAQVAGVLTNLAEMYTHLGAAREELELRERVLTIRGDDPGTDATMLQRLRDRVAELRSTLAAEEPSPDGVDDDLASLPIVRTAEYDVPRTASPVAIESDAVEPAAVALEAESEPETVVDVQAEAIEAPATPKVITPVVVVSAPFPAVAREPEVVAVSQDDVETSPEATRKPETPGADVVVIDRSDCDEVAEPVLRASVPRTPSPARAMVEVVAVSDSPVLQLVGAVDHGFSDMGRDELAGSEIRRGSRRSTLYSIAAGVILVAGLIAAREFVGGSDDGRVSADGSVSLANAAQPAPAAAAPAPASGREDPTVESLVAGRESGRTAMARGRGAEDDDAPAPAAPAPRVPTAFELARPLRGVDVAVKAIGQQTRAAADSATAIRLQDPTFKKSKLADP